MAPINNLSGRRFGRLLVLKRHAENSKDGHARWECLCDPEQGGCGNTPTMTMNVLTKGTTYSCGCHRKQIKTIHGLIDSEEHQAWTNMKQRCYNELNHKYKDYGARGITVCDEWKDSFETFYKDMGPKPSPEHSLDRENNDKGYSKGNCRWATRIEQASNTRRNVFHLHLGVYKTLSAWCRELNLNKHTVASRLAIGWSFEKAITTPMK